MTAGPLEIIRTERLRLRLVEPGDAAVYLEILNDPAFIEHIGDRGVRTLEAAVSSIENGPIAMQRTRGHSMYLVERLEDGRAVGLSGLIKRDGLEDVDIGYAFLPHYRGHGYAFEAAQGVVAHARLLGIPRLVAITTQGNAASIQLLLRLGMRYQGTRVVVAGEPALNLYGMELSEER
ncbi:GNAT family N-acetyltransferase [Massilia sp. IC2-477]|uniref:GNAT family N-acetyltransferase n=1 Tax=Massilia sp. IC2-477 TaxID=2887198 RepID=UPI001D0F9893|nr:GNAT family N-acetyltransferase [Massilia sp. IC2-477]MCC2957238.1 GNAT family N-acetyltransferase [Massilia sp. IC2-477]